jgi:cob(I)alamin adenosyltransferase
VARRAERRIISLSHEEEINNNSRIYLNRLSDLCFIVSRWLCQQSEQGEVLWQPSQVKPK